MNALNARTALQHAVPGVVLMAIVLLITVAFNVLGTIACSVLTGMLLGASRHWKWHVVPVSLVFPIAVLCLLEFSKGDILPHTRYLLAAVCWGGFVVTYLITYLLVCFERQNQDKSEAIDSNPVAPAVIPAGSEALPADPLPVLTLRQVQGEWAYEPLPQERQSERRVIKVTGDAMALWVTNGKGQPTCEAKGRLKLE